MNSRTSLLILSSLVSLGSAAHAQTTCPAPSANISNFNGTDIKAPSYIWFNANFTASGIPSSGANIFFSNSTVTFTSDSKSYTANVPNAQIYFSPTAACAATTFNTATNTWMTTLPLQGSDEIFLSGVAFPVPTGFGGKVQGPVNWQGSFSSDIPGITVSWKWGAAVYTAFSTDYNLLSIKPTHTDTCMMYPNSDHAGTPEGIDPNSGQPFKASVTGGARGGGGSNWTGSWSSTQSVNVCVMMMIE